MTEVLPDHSSLIIDTYAEKAYLDYAIAVVKGRALGQVEDGQKPVQLRILYAMHDMGLTHTAKLRKCAAMVGEVLGKYHPHGDQSVYDAMVRMAQPFSLRYPLVDGQGNFGSRDGDRAAAMRYTEARLTPIASLLLSELGAGTVDFGPNYDGAFQEPLHLPARLPMLLLNGAMGIAVGMACDLPSHNLREVAAAAIAVIENPDITTDQLVDIIPGPDFATGAQLISTRADVLSAYESGRGNLRARAVWKKEDLARGQWQIVITEMPYQVSALGILMEVEVLTNPQPKSGKKTLDQQQTNLKAVSLNLLETVRDESGKDAGVRLVIVPRSAKQSPEETMAFLFANTQLEKSVIVNNTCIGLDGNPRTKGLKDLLTEWAAFRAITVRRRSQHELDKVSARLHLLEGRVAVYLNVDEVVATIRGSEDPKAELMAKFTLSDIQAEDILEMRLRQLARLEGFKLEKEAEDCRKEKARLEMLLANPDALNKLIIKEITADAAKFGDDRRTLIKAEARASALPAARTVPDEAVTIIVSKNLWVRARSGHDVDEATLTYKAGDVGLAILKTRTTQTVLFLDSRGRAYSVQASDIPNGRGDGVPLTTLIDVQEGATVMHCLADHVEQNYLFSGSNGYGFVAPLKALVARPKAGKAFLTLDEGEAPLVPVRLPSTTEGFVAVGSTESKMLCFPIAEVKALEKGGKGVMLMGLEDTDTVSGVTYFDAVPFRANIELKGQVGAITFGKADMDKYLGRRARKGALLPKRGLLRK
jgi:topoisomerase-4 subunit A